ncbi:hypothetical protein EJB05_37436, partial [Eragrostis curvula]
MASSSEGGRAGKQPANSSSQGKEASLAEVKSEKKKKKIVRMPQEQIASYFSCVVPKPRPLPFEGCPPGRFIDSMDKEFLATLPQDIVDRLATVDLNLMNQRSAEVNKINEDFAKEIEDVRRQYLEKGYVEYEVTDDEDEEARSPAAPAPPAPGRRRFV